jgi:hypothetical protein
MDVDPSRFDGLARLVASPRRAVLRAALGGVLAAAEWSAIGLDASAKRGKRKKKRCQGYCLGPPRRCCPSGTRPASAIYGTAGSCECCPEKRVWVSRVGARLCCPAGTRAMPKGGASTNGGQCCQEDQFCNETCCDKDSVCRSGKCVRKCANGNAWCKPANGDGICCDWDQTCRVGQCLDICDSAEGETQCDTGDGRFFCCESGSECQNSRADLTPRCCPHERACDDGSCCGEGRRCHKNACVQCEPEQAVAECPSGLAICCEDGEVCYDLAPGVIDCCQDGGVCERADGGLECCRTDEECTRIGCQRTCADHESPCEREDGSFACCDVDAGMECLAGQCWPPCLESQVRCVIGGREIECCSWPQLECREDGCYAPGT